jgi:hypothetical protein
VATFVAPILLDQSNRRNHFAWVGPWLKEAWAILFAFMIWAFIGRRTEADVTTKVQEGHLFQDRHLSLEQVNYIVASVNAFSGQSIVIDYVLGDAESQVYAQEIAQVLESAQWNIKRVNGLTITFRGLRIMPQDPTDVPLAADALIRAFGEQSIPIGRDYVQPTSFEYNGNNYVPTLYLFVGKNGEPTRIPPKYSLPIVTPNVPDLPGDVRNLSNDELAEYTERTVTALREYEIRNRQRFEAEWHVHGTPLAANSYRGFFENVLRPPATRLRDEIHGRLGIGPTIVWALDADALDGIQPLRDAAQYLDELARRLRRK